MPFGVPSFFELCISQFSHIPGRTGTRCVKQVIQEREIGDKLELQPQSSVPALCDGIEAVQTCVDQALQECEMQSFQCSLLTIMDVQERRS